MRLREEDTAADFNSSIVAVEAASTYHPSTRLSTGAFMLCS